MKAYLLSLMIFASLLGESRYRTAAERFARKETADFFPPNETVRFDNIVPALISVFDHADVLALSDFHLAEVGFRPPNFEEASA